jgi:hypothetical protein
LGLWSGCAITRTVGWNQGFEGSSLSEKEVRKLSTEAKSHWEKRLDRAELEQALSSWEKLANANPSDFESRAMLARGYYLLADGHIPDAQMEEKKKFWEIGTSWGEKALATNASFRKRVQDEQKPVEEALDALTRTEVPAIYWTAVNLGKWAKNSNITTTLKYKTRIKKMIERVEALDPDYFYGATNRYWGVYYSALPKLFGGSLEKSQEHFQKSLKTANDYYGTHVLYAEMFFAKKGDRAGFRRELNFVLGGKPNVIPELVAENTIEQRKAKAMLEREKELFE